MLTALIASLIGLHLESQSVTPIVAPIKYPFGDPIISISIDGQPPQDFGLNMSSRHSIVTNKVDAGSLRQLSINGRNLGPATLEYTDGPVRTSLNALGLGFLNGMAIGMDYAKNEVTLWPGGHLTPESAKSWILGAPKWGSESKVWTLPIQRKVGVAPVIPISINGKKINVLLRIGQQGTAFIHDVEPTSGIPVEYGQGGNQAILTNLEVGPATLPWILYFRGVKYDPSKEIDPSILGTFTTDNFLARRVIVDLPANALYVEQLSPDEQAAMFLSTWFQLPVDVQGSKMIIREMPGTRAYPQLTPIYESEILEIMGQSSEQILAATRGKTTENMKYLKLLFERIWNGYKVKFKMQNGDVHEANFSPPKG